MLVILITCAGIFLLYNVYHMFFGHEKKIELLLGIATLIAIFVGVFSLQATIASYEGTVAQNRVDLEQNLIQKYDIDSLGDDIGTKESRLDPTQASKQFVTIVYKGKEYLYVLSQNEETYEPKLTDPPVRRQY